MARAMQPNMILLESLESSKPFSPFSTHTIWWLPDTESGVAKQYCHVSFRLPFRHTLVILGCLFRQDKFQVVSPYGSTLFWEHSFLCVKQTFETFGNVAARRRKPLDRSFLFFIVVAVVTSILPVKTKNGLFDQNKRRSIFCRSRLRQNKKFLGSIEAKNKNCFCFIVWKKWTKIARTWSFPVRGLREWIFLIFRSPSDFQVLMVSFT